MTADVEMKEVQATSNSVPSATVPSTFQRTDANCRGRESDRSSDPRTLSPRSSCCFFLFVN